MVEYQTYPIILAHGITRFDFLANWLLHIDNDSNDDGLHYFRNIRTHIMATKRFDVHHSHVSWATDVEVRADELKQEVENVLHKSSASKVHIIAHSMGGLDARHMLYKNRAAEFQKKVASLTTIATPHCGTSIADHILGMPTLDGDLAKAVAKIGLGENLAGFKSITTKACEIFNEQAEAWENSCGVQFRTYAGTQKWSKIFLPFRAFWGKIKGPHDGLVSVDSAKWQDKYFVEPIIDADHFNLTGWTDISELPDIVSFLRMETKIKRLYLTIAKELAEAFPI